MFDLNAIWIRMTARQIGEDEFGNQYFESKKSNYLGKKVRQVTYKGVAEPSKIPPMFHAWLHYLIDEIPVKPGMFTWQKHHTPNLTGTKFAYSPCGVGNKRAKISSDYQSWQPNR